MQTRLDKGEFNPATTRVLHFVANPEAEAHKEAQTERISKLEAEVATLKLQTSMTDTSHSSGVSGTAETALAALEARAVITAQKVCSSRTPFLQVSLLFYIFREAFPLPFHLRTSFISFTDPTTHGCSASVALTRRCLDLPLEAFD